MSENENEIDVKEEKEKVPNIQKLKLKPTVPEMNS